MSERRLHRDQVDRVLRRASELQAARDRDRVETIDVAAVEQAATEAGIEADLLRAALAELEEEAPDTTPRPLPERASGPLLDPPDDDVVVVERVLPVTPEQVRNALDRTWPLHERAGRQRPAVLIEPAGAAGCRVVLRSDVRATTGRHAAAGLGITVVAALTGYDVAGLMWDVAQGGVFSSVVRVVDGAFEYAPLLGLGAGAGWLSGRLRLRSKRRRTAQRSQRLLDLLEADLRGAPRPDPQAVRG